MDMDVHMRMFLSRKIGFLYLCVCALFRYFSQCIYATVLIVSAYMFDVHTSSLSCHTMFQVFVSTIHIISYMYNSLLCLCKFYLSK